ncbi:MAG: hypothetical protein JL50_02305 [Peptococcaceae bacterium BICA1-7]|nr:MAG: hypothetical protein JL50_02305 [Peptococcaceae bacterium BICA1-7]HBV95460.1 efflux RND transporter periplasmic adaptor subunit [Desulfotomaculum sp.]
MSEGKGRKWKKPAIILSVVVILVVLIVVRAQTKKDKDVTTQERLQPVAVTAVTSRPFGEELSIAGAVTAFTEAKLAPRVTGRVVSVNARVGQRVAQGEVLLTIDQSDYQTALRVAEANLSAARANSIQAETGYENAKANYGRTEELFNQGAVSQSQLEKARGEYAMAETAYKSNQAQIAQCQAALDKAVNDFESTVVRAPFAGVVAQRLTDMGELVSQQTPVYTLIQDRPLLVKVNLAESMVSHVALQQQVDIFVSATGKSYQGTVSSVAPQSDGTTRAYPAEITLDNPGEEVKPGMVADLRLITRKVDSALVVPTEAILEGDSSPGVFVIENDTAHARKITTGMVGQGYSQVLSGLSEGEMVAVKGNHLLVDGMKVQVKEAEAESSPPAPTGGESN